jgi:hypothetical protein
VALQSLDRPLDLDLDLVAERGAAQLHPPVTKARTERGHRLADLPRQPVALDNEGGPFPPSRRGLGHVSTRSRVSGL